jgi:hypothetical protein
MTYEYSNLNPLCVSKVYCHLCQFYSYPQNQFLVMISHFDNLLDKSLTILMPYERSNHKRWVNFHFNWLFSSQLKPKLTLTRFFKYFHSVESHACSINMFEFVFSHLQIGSTFNSHPKAIKCLMMVVQAMKTLENDLISEPKDSLKKVFFRYWTFYPAYSSTNILFNV